MRHFLIPCLLVMVLSLGCGKSSDETTIDTEHGKTTIKKDGSKTVVQAEDGTKTTFETKDNVMKMESKEGRFTVGDNKLPEGFPLSLMPGSKIQQANHLTPTDGPEVFQVTTENAGEPKAIAAFYEKSLKDKGLKVERFDSSSDQGSQAMLTANSDQAEAVVAVMKEGKAATSSVTISWSKKKK